MDWPGPRLGIRRTGGHTEGRDSQRLPGEAESQGIGHRDLDQIGIGGLRIVDQEDRSLLGRDDRLIGEERRHAGNQQSKD